MIYFKHRCNQVKDLDSVEAKWGVEIDLRSDVSQAGELHLSHDPGLRGENFKNWLSVFKAKRIQGPIILNTKEDGLEALIETILAEQEVENYIFLDTALPTLVKQCLVMKKDKFFVRLSKYEPAEFALRFAGSASWLWVDCFDREPLAAHLVAPLKKHFKICLVSPELQQGGPGDFPAFKELASLADGICTKLPGSI